MGISERKMREREEMKRNIIKAATAMFINEGYEKTSIRGIADKIEYSPATIYLYYKDKDELLYDVQHYGFEQMATLFTEVATDLHPYKRLRQLCRAYIQFGMENSALYDLMFIVKDPMNAINQEDQWTNSVDCFTIFMGCVQECVDKGLIRFPDARLAALSIWGMGHGLLSLNICCRLQIMQLDQAHLNEALYLAVDNYLNMVEIL
ncbi:MAG: TetR/AcrR family transcriptional regulator [Chitinophagia bacterium]|nr:TetR/AcrR family transcriptional regulator [Chitinophagia bacterium]